MESLQRSQTQSWLSWFFRGLMIVGFLGLLARVVDLQVIRGAYFRDLAESNRIRRVPIVAARGNITARGGEVIVGNEAVQKRVIFDPMEGYEKTDEIEGAPEEDIITEYIRDYRLGSRAAHATGYLGQVTEDEADKVDAGCPDKGPRSRDAWVGRGGLEESYECELRGIDGEELVEVDSFGQRIRTLGRKDPQAGNDIRTTLHYGLQAHIADILSGKKEFDRGDIPEEELRAAVVVTDTKGEILAFYSSPSFDPNAFVKEGKRDTVASYLTNERLPLFNRVIGGAFHPGSVFKPIVGIAALESGAIDDDYTYTDTGSVVIESLYGDFTYNNWYFTQYGGTEGEIGLERALARSTDTYFYKVGELVGMETLNQWTERFGLGYQTGVDIPGEIQGLVPNPEWKRLAKGERWFLGNTYHFSIGQSDTVLTPLQVNTSIAALASGGELCKPHFVGDAECKDLELDEAHLAKVREGMIEACSAGGTAFTFFEVNDEASDFTKGKVACKTGTAETETNTDTTHAWFTFFAPVSEELGKEPEIVATILVEEGGEGSKIAGPIGRSIFDYWYGKHD